jgi:hypothetical protein
MNTLVEKEIECPCTLARPSRKLSKVAVQPGVLLVVSHHKAGVGYAQAQQSAFTLQWWRLNAADRG